jgi:hypothetical protein
VQIKTKKHFNEIIKSLTKEIVEEEELEEISTTAGVDGYSTPFAFRGKGKKGKKKNKEISTNSTGYDVVNEVLSNKDLEIIKKLIRDTVADVYRDIWIKRNSWK